MKTYGNLETKELISLSLLENGEIDFRPLCPRGKFLIGTELANKFPNFAWVPPKVVELVKNPEPIYDKINYYAIPNLIWTETSVTRDWEVKLKNLNQILEQMTIECSNISQKRLDDLAISWGYDSIVSLVSYAGDLNPRFNAEGIAGKKFRSDEWSAADTFRKNCLLGLISPSIEEYINHLPEIPARPIIE